MVRMMRILGKYLWVAALLAAGSAVALADTYTDKLAKVQVTIPGDFNTTRNGQTLTVSAPDETVSMVIDSLAETDLEAAGKAIDKRAAEQVSDLKFKGSPRKVKINGLAGVTLTGSGTVKTKAVRVNTMALITPANRVFFVITTVNDDATKAAAPVVQQILSSIKAV